MKLADRVRTTRILFAIVAVVYPVFGILRQAGPDPAEHDPLPLRGMVSLTALALLGLSYSDRFSRRWLYPCVMVVVYLITAHFFYLLATNALDPDYLVGLLIVLAGVLAAGPLAFRTRKDLVAYLVLVSGGCLASMAAVEDPAVSLPFYALAVFTTVGLSYVALGYQLSTRRKLMESRSRLDALVQGAPVVLWSVDRSGRIDFANSRVLDVAGEAAEAYEGRPLSSLLGNAPGIAEATERALAGEDAAATVAIDGRVLETLQVPRRDAAGEIVGAFGVATDVTARERSRRELERRERQLQDAQAIAHCGSWEWDVAEDRVEWSDETFRIFGMEPGGPLTYEDFLVRLHEEDRDRIESIIADAYRDPKGFEFEERILRPDGEVRTLRNRGRVVTDDRGRAVRMIGTCYDVTEIRASEERVRRAQRMEAAGRVAGSIAHDFNNLLTIIRGFSEDLADRLRDPTDRESATEIRKAAGRAAELTRKLLTFSRSEDSRVEAVPLEPLLDDTRGLLERVASGKARLSIDVDAGVGAVRADGPGVEQCLVNLVINARDAIEERGEISIVARPSDGTDGAPDEDGEWIVVEVRDTGRGIDPSIREQIFEPFFTTKPAEKGTGLGLSTVYGIMRRAGGRVTVESEPGEGTTFRLWFRPAGVQEPETAGAP